MQPVAETEDFFLLMDPDVQADFSGEAPPLEAVIGAWPLENDGTVGAFRSNPDYRPLNPQAAADPLDALFRLVGRGAATAEQIQLVMRDMLMDLALNGDGPPLITKSPDDISCVVVATSGAQMAQTPAPAWQRVDLMTLVSMVPDSIDVFFNPHGAMPFRLTGDFVRETLLMSDEEIAEAQQSLSSELPERISIATWIGNPDDEVAEEPSGPVAQ